VRKNYKKNIGTTSDTGFEEPRPAMWLTVLKCKDAAAGGNFSCDLRRIDDEFISRKNAKY